jgi:cardiolipin synthase
MASHATIPGESAWLEQAPEIEPLDRQACTVAGYPTLAGNRLILLADFESIFRSLIRDIHQAGHTCHLEFYIWEPGGLADELFDALLAASRRGVACRILLDALGSKQFLRGAQISRLREAGVAVVPALSVSPLTLLFQRADLRDHRKIAVIDSRIGYTGSQNLVDPCYFKQDAVVGEWVDLMIRIEGPAVAALGSVFALDWEVEANEPGSLLPETGVPARIPEYGSIPVQVVPSGPVFREGAIHQLLMTVLFMARRELVITTPYFIPDDGLIEALIAAQRRGVSITIIMPERIDSLLVRYAMPALLGRLVAAGIRIARYRSGLLHTKSISVDEKFCVVGSVNLDMRSLWLNFEISLFVYDPGFAARMRALQQQYLDESNYLDPGHFQSRSRRQELLAGIMRLLSPVL